MFNFIHFLVLRRLLEQQKLQIFDKNCQFALLTYTNTYNSDFFNSFTRRVDV